MGDRKEEVPLQIPAIYNCDAPKVSNKYAWTLGACWILFLALILLGFSDRQYELDAQPTTRIRNYEVLNGADSNQKAAMRSIEAQSNSKHNS